jgi:uncharacterized alkaline shock family protein YloU
MKNGILDRIMVFCYVVITAALAVITALRAFEIDLAQRLFDGLAHNAPGILWRLIVVGIAAIVVLLGLYTVVVITPSRRKKSNFITISGDESGEVKVALPALRDMVRQAIGRIDGISDMNVDVIDAGDAVAVVITLDVDSSVHVPTLTMNMQRAVRTYIQTSCGVAVKNVSVVIKNVIATPDAQPVKIESEAPAEMPVIESPRAEAVVVEDAPAPEEAQAEEAAADGSAQEESI